jgi:Tfp pilus assembly protein PilF
MWHLHNVLKTQPENSEANLNMAIIFINQKRFDEAAEYLLKILKTKSDNTDVYYNMGIILGTQGGKNRQLVPMNRR